MSLPPSTTARRATPADEDALWALQVHREDYLRAKGMPSLASGMSEAQQRGFLREHLAHSEVWAFVEAGRVVGQARLHPDDTAFWPDRPEPRAGYVHGLQIAEGCHGRGLGLAILHWAEEQWRGRGKACLRLDCSANNPRLLAYYREAGYQAAGNVTLAHGWGSVRFEKPL